ncbi:unnamed protein product [Trichobilharzia szidati]|nr:unnamed protein product [Trichobilharzia szidati]
MKIPFLGLCILSLLVISCSEARPNQKQRTDELVKRAVLVDTVDVPPISRRQFNGRFGGETTHIRRFY